MQINNEDILNTQETKLIYILEDETAISELVALNLNKSNFKTKEFTHAKKLFKTLEEKIPDLLILDLMLPDIDGIEVCKYIRKEKKFRKIPIIMLTAKAEELDRIIGLEIGADDYIIKPFSTRELVARVKAVLRRESNFKPESEIIRKGNLIIDMQKYEVKNKGLKIELTHTEFKILKLLLDKPGWVYSRNQILDFIDTNEKGILDRTVDVHIKNLREKLGESGFYIKNIRGVGYKFDET